MAHTAGVSRERIMLVRLHEMRRTRAMSVVALSAVDLRATQSEMQRAEPGRLAIVAGEAQSRNPLCQQALDGTVVRLVTGKTVAIRRR
jgi:hypothetical protein